MRGPVHVYSSVHIYVGWCSGSFWNAAILSSLRARNHRRPLPVLTLHMHIFNVAFQSLFYCHIFRVVTIEQ